MWSAFYHNRLEIHQIYLLLYGDKKNKKIILVILFFDITAKTIFQTKKQVSAKIHAKETMLCLILLNRV